MTQEEKVKAYDKAIERAKSLIGDTIIEESGQHIAEVIFPELKESEDERIRKTLIDYFNTCAGDYYGELKLSSIIAWLEKQGEQKSILNVPTRDIILSIWDLGNEWKELTNGCISTKYGTQLDYIQKHWHESEYYLKEKQGEQKSIDKVEPKFKVGDWITNDTCVIQITSVDDKYYWQDNDCVGGDIESIDKEYHLWTIQDAKDGDVLVASDGSIFIFNSSDNDGCKFHVALTTDNKLVIDHKLKHHWKTSTAIHPATKKQRDTLTKAMLSLGYTFDFDKKELKKIKKESKKIKKESKNSNSYCQEHWKGFHETGKCFADGDCKDKREAEQKSTWSEEDEKILVEIIVDIEVLKEQEMTKYGKELYQEEIDWLKSLKQRIGG